MLGLLGGQYGLRLMGLVAAPRVLIILQYPCCHKMMLLPTKVQTGPKQRSYALVGTTRRA